MSKRIEIDISETGGWIRLDVKDDIRISYPIWGEDKDKHIDKFAADLKRALNGERLSTLG